MKEEQILQLIKTWMEELFEINPEQIKMDTNLFEDLDIDSIDAIDLVVKIKNETGKPITPEQFKEVRLVKDIVSIVENLENS